MILPNALPAGPYLRRLRGATAAVLTLAGLLLAPDSVPAGDDAPARRFPLRDRGPFNAMLGIGAGWPDPAGPAMELSWDIASHAMAQQAGDETLILDGETHALTLRLQRQWSDRLSIAAELPWITHGGGFMDDVIDAWHDAFGLSEGIRPSLPNGDLRFLYALDGVQTVTLDDTTSGIGDLRTSAAWRVGTRARMAIDLIGEIEWPTGDAARLTGNGHTDFAASVRLAPAGDRQRFGWSLIAGVTWPGDVDLALPATERQIWHYDLAVAWAAWPALDLILQVAGHSSSYESDIDMLGGTALQLGGGFVWRITPRYSVRFGVFEDIRTDTMPDFASELALVVNH